MKKVVVSQFPEPMSDTFSEHGTVQRADVTQRLAALGEMTGGIAHDFKNILAVIESGLRLIERNLDSPDKQRVCIDATRDGIKRGQALTAQLLAFAKQQEPGIHAADVNQLLRGLELFLNYGAGPGVRVMLDLAPQLPNCRIDSSQFGTVLLNLIVNARDAMPNGGEIRIRTERSMITDGSAVSLPTGGFIRVSVQDDGQGMPEHVVQRVFDPYFTTKGENGTGLGLPQVRAFMRQVGGDITISSQLGCGTTIHLFFPVSETVPPLQIAEVTCGIP